MTAPKPRGRKPVTVGERLKAAILAGYELNPAEMALLAQAAAIADALELVNAELRGRPLITAGSTGQDVADPLLAVQRQHAETLARLVAAIGFPAAGADEGVSSTSKAAQRAAHVRWAIHREQEAG